MWSEAAFAAILLVAAQGVFGLSVEDANATLSLSYARGLDASTSVGETVEFELQTGIRLSPYWRWRGSAALNYDRAQALRPHAADERVFDFASGASRDVALGAAGFARLRDFYLEWQRGRATARLGKQQLAWHVLDGLPLIEINPNDFHEFVLNTPAERRLTQWGGYVDLPIRRWRLEGAVFSDRSVHDVADPGAWFEFTAPQFRFGVQGGDMSTLPTIDTRLPRAFEDAAWAVRLSRRFGDTRVALVGHVGNEHQPLGRLETVDDQTVLVRRYPRRSMVGMTLESGWGAVVLRAEALYERDKALNVVNGSVLGEAQADVFGLGVGADFDLPLGLFANLQWIGQTVRDAPDGLLRRAQSRYATLTLRRSFFYDNLNLEWRWYQNLENGGFLRRGSVRYAISDRLSLAASADVFSGPDDGVFGQFDQRDRVLVELRFAF